MNESSERQYLEDVPKDLQDLIYAGQKIQAIKLAREKMGWGLKDAKERVEEVEARMREELPGALPERQAAGCGTAVLALLVLVGAGVFLWIVVA